MAEKKKRFLVNIQFSLLWLLIFTIAILCSLIYIPWQILSTQNIELLVKDINNELMNSIMREISRNFERAITTQHTIREVFIKKIIDINNKEEREQYYLTLLEANPWFTWVSFGAPNGDFFGAQRITKDVLNVVDNKWINSTEKAVRRIDFYERHDEDYIFKASHVLYNYDYYSPQRSWFKQAAAETTDIWTEVYIFSTSNKPGINSALALDIDGKFVGVISVAFELEDISLFLQNLKVGKNGKVFIIDAKEQLLASRNPEEIAVTAAQNETPSMRKIGEIDNPFLHVATGALRQSNQKMAEINQFMYYNYYDELTRESYFVTFMPAQYLDWKIATVIPRADYMSEIEQKSLLILLVVSLAVVLVSILVVLLSKRIIVRPILSITKQLEFVQAFLLDKVTDVKSRIIEINILSGGIKKMTQGLLSFQKYIPTEVVRGMLAAGIEAEIGGNERELTMMFSDLAGFTQIFEKCGNALIPQLGEYFSEMSEQIMKENGAIDKYIGDCIMAFWGAPAPNPSHALCACRAVLACKKVLQGLCARWQTESKPQFVQRTGVNTGLVVVGNMGSNRRLNYTVLGDPVNLASRLEGLNRIYKTDILLGENTFRATAEHIIARKVDCVTVLGKSETENIYELIAMREQVSVTDRFEWISAYEKGHELYRAQQWQEAIAHFRKALELKGGADYPSQLFIHYCAQFMKNPPGPRWNGVTAMKSK